MQLEYQKWENWLREQPEEGDKDKGFLDQCLSNVALSLQTLFHGLFWSERGVSLEIPGLGREYCFVIHREHMLKPITSDSASAFNLVLYSWDC